LNRADLQQLAEDRVLDAGALLLAGRWAAAYYLAGYAVECALKAAIARRTNQYDFPSKALALRAYSHDLPDLLDLAGLKLQLQMDTVPGPNALAMHWQLVKNWNERTRYEQKPEADARDLIRAITDPSDGVLPWIKRHW
jgi:HEPN domain-containing protein